MSQWDKLLARLLTLPSDVRFAEVKKVLEHYGYLGSKPRSGSSHWTFRRKGSLPITVPESEPVRLAYVKKIKTIVESEEGRE